MTRRHFFFFPFRFLFHIEFIMKVLPPIFSLSPPSSILASCTLFFGNQLGIKLNRENFALSSTFLSSFIVSVIVIRGVNNK